MAGFQYRLQPLLEQKTAARENAAEMLASRQRELRQEQDTLTGLRNKEQELTEKKACARRSLITEAPTAGISTEDIRRRVLWLKHLEHQLEQARDDVFSQRIVIEDCERSVDEARQALVECTRQEDVLKKHRERAQHRFRKEEERRDALEQDEIGSLLYAARKRSE